MDIDDKIGKNLKFYEEGRDFKKMAKNSFLRPKICT